MSVAFSLHLGGSEHLQSQRHATAVEYYLQTSQTVDKVAATLGR